MAGEWIKVEFATSDKPEVLKIARILGIDPDCAFGKLIRLWAWMDKVSVDGVVDGVVDGDVDRICGQSGFARACEAVGWLSCDGASEKVVLPNFDRHNGESSKKRALKNERQSRWRGSKSPQASTPASTNASTREEKRREDKRTPVVPLPEWLDAGLWSEFVSHRKEIGKPLTERASTRMLAKLSTLRSEGVDLRAAIDASIRNGWQDVFAPKPGRQADSAHDPFAGAL